MKKYREKIQFYPDSPEEMTPRKKRVKRISGWQTVYDDFQREDVAREWNALYGHYKSFYTNNWNLYYGKGKK